MEYQILALFLFVLYMIPTWVAERRKHKNVGGIAVLNVLLGWTFLFWVVALVWACTDGSKPKSQVDEMRELIKEMQALQEANK